MHTALRWIVAALLIVATAAPATARADSEAAARQAVARGEALFNAQNYAAALTEFGVAYQLLEGHARRFMVLANLAACHERMFHYDLAVGFYRDYLREGGERVEDRSAVEERVRSLEQLLATLTVHSNVPADVWIDDRKAGRAPGTIRLSPGKHLIELRAPLHEAARKEVDLAAGAASSLRFQLQELSQFSGLSPAYFWTFTALTVAAVGAGTVLGIMAVEADAAGNARARRDPFLNTVEDEQSVQRTATAADVAFIGAAVFGASAAVLFFLTDWQGPSGEQQVALQPFAAGDPRAWQVGVRGRL